MPSSRRIAVIAACPFPYPRGTPVRIQRLAEALAARGHDVHVATYHLGHGDAAAGVTIHRIRDVPAYRKLSPGPSYRKLAVVDRLLTATTRELLAGGAFDVIHAHHYEGLLIAAAARRGTPVPLVYDAHTLLASELPYYRVGLPQWLKRGLGAAIDRRVPPLADFVVTVTAAIRDEMIAAGIVPATDVEVIANGVEAEFHEVAADRHADRVVFAGNLAAYQGIATMLHAFARVARTHDHVRLLLLTDSSFDDYAPLARELGIAGRIDIRPTPLEQLPGRLATAAVALNPREDCAGIPQKLLNYMAVGNAVVSFAGSAPVLEHGRTGWVVDNGDVQAFADGIVAMLDDEGLAQRLGANARAYVRTHHTWEAAAQRCEAIYDRLVG